MKAPKGKSKIFKEIFNDDGHFYIHMFVCVHIHADVHMHAHFYKYTVKHGANC